MTKEYRGLSTKASLEQIYKIEGARGYFKGNGANIIKIVPFTAFEFYFYEVFKTGIFPTKQKHELSVLDKLVCGGLTGSTASFLTYPIDLIKTHLCINVENKGMGVF